MSIPGSSSAAVRKCIFCHSRRSLGIQEEVFLGGMLLLLQSGLFIVAYIYTLLHIQVTHTHTYS